MSPLLRSASTRTPSPAVVTTPDGRLVADRCLVADRAWPRMRGLLGRRSLEAGEGLLIEPAGSIHMLGMRFAIDAAFLDRGRRVLRVAEGLAPWRMAACRGARSVLELPAGTLARTGLAAGDELRFAPARPAAGGPGKA
ncbi:MAG TPA: DUF192 domain-containing protein [Solirubrobacteraceae bacterium]|jgi:uncharacterized membrane protein (UPF0127 family)|nr:DUF192 domain-containing protein [Solirubrobacteraceae bacterium]